MLIKIGDFAKSTGVTIKALRHYEKLGLLIPVWVNRFNGYRYYAPEQQERTRKKLVFKNMGFSLKDIALLLDPGLDKLKLKALLEKQIDTLESQILQTKSRSEKLKIYLENVMSSSPNEVWEEIQAIQQLKNNQLLQERIMEIQIKEIPAFTIIGVRYQGNNKNNEIADVWTKFNERQKEIGNFAGEGAYGICSIPAGLPEGEFEYICALPVSKVDDLPEGIVTRNYPAMRVAVFEQRGSYENLRKTYSNIYKKWLPEAGLQPLENGFDLEVYDDKFKGFAPDSVMYIYVPI